MSEAAISTTTGVNQGRWRASGRRRASRAAGHSEEVVAGAGKPNLFANPIRSRINTAGC
jgi:hypothetical protein